MAYRILGLLCVGGAVAFLALLAASLVLLTIYRRQGRLPWPRVSAFVGGLLYSPLSVVLRLFGKSTQVLDLFLIDAANAVMANAFATAGPERMIVMPQCMRASGCKAKLHPMDGYICVRCGRCRLGELSKVAEENGFRFFIVPGDRYAKRLLKRFAADAAIGVACPCELSAALLAGLKMGVAAMGVPLGRDGCFETDVDIDQVKDAIRRCGKSPSE